MQTVSALSFPDWLPDDVHRYLEHTVAGVSIRKLARRDGYHPSTVMRQVHRIEGQREDFLIDRALADLAKPAAAKDCEPEIPSAATGAEDGRLIEALTRLCQQGTVLAVAEGMPTAVIVKEDAPGDKLPIPRSLAAVMALRRWVSCSRRGRLCRYHVTPEGRAALRDMVAPTGAGRADPLGFGEQAAGFQHETQSAAGRHLRYGGAESPLDLLGRLPDKQGSPFLAPELVEAGKRLREDFELGQVGDHLLQTAAQFGQTDQIPSPRDAWPSPLTLAAQARARAAFLALGEGLSDIALRCCCHLEGLETAERQLGWSARSGKIVLRIALEQLRAHYDALDGQKGRDDRIG